MFCVSTTEHSQAAVYLWRNRRTYRKEVISMENMRNEKMEKVTLDDLAKASGGVIVEEGDGRFWVVRQDGTVYAPAPSLEKAIEYAKTLSISTEVLTKAQYRKRFGRDLQW